MTDQETNLRARQLFPKRGHPSFAMRNDRDQTSVAGDVRMLSPPLSLSKVRRVVSVTQGRVTATIGAVATRAVISEQIDC